MWSIKKHRFYVGIDTGVNTGYCLWDSQEKKIVMLKTMKIHKALDEVEALNIHNAGEVFVRVEDARKATFGRRQEAHKAMGAGSVMRDAGIWEDFLKDHRIDHVMVRPNAMTTKLMPLPFQKITGFMGSTSQHARDACMLVFKMS